MRRRFLMDHWFLTGLAALAFAAAVLALWISNSQLRGDRELNKVSAVGDPPHLCESGRRDWASIAEGQGRIAVQGGGAACRVVIDLEVGELPFQVTGIPERDLVEKFSTDRPDQALDKRV